MNAMPTFESTRIVINVARLTRFRYDTRMNCAVCTLFENDYHLGVGALVNSLHNSGFTGCVFAGYRGELPPWARHANAKDDGTHILAITDNLKIQLIPISTDTHFANYKARYMIYLLNTHAANAKQLHYFDPDIVVRCDWGTMETWATDGVALSEDAFGSIGSRHPLRLKWKNWLHSINKECVRELESYYNSGYVGIDTKYKDFLDAWNYYDESVCHQIGSDKAIFNGNSRINPFQFPDQDALNIALMCNSVPINATGPEGMDLLGKKNGYLLSHCTGSNKPWRSGILSQALNGRPPERKQRMFWQYANNPIRVFSPVDEFWLKLKFKIAEHISRFYSKKCN